MHRSTTKKLLIFGTVVIVTLVLAYAIYRIVLSNKTDDDFDRKYSVLGIYKKAAVSTTGRECAQIGSDILKKNGSAVDAAIAALLCEGVSSLHSMGLGGGFFMTIYDGKTGKAEFLDARETAPKSAYVEMFHGNKNLAYSGGLSVAVPGELLGYKEAHEKYGRLKWEELFQPTIELCKKGNLINSYLYSYMKKYEKSIKNEETLREILVDPKTNELFGVGDRIRRPKLAETLKILSQENGTQLFYNGSIAKDLVKEINDFGGNFTIEDFRDYRTVWTDAMETPIKNMTMFTAPLPGSGVILTFMLNVLEKLLPIEDESIMWQYLVETYKWAYAKRTELGDPFDENVRLNISSLLKKLTSQDYADIIAERIKKEPTSTDPKHYGAVTISKNDHGTSQVSVLAPDGSAVSATSTINQVFGAKIRSKSTGIIFNDEMDDFSSPNITNAFDLPPSPNNYIKVGKRPMSSMAPSIVIGEDRKVRLVIGAAGGTKITSSLAFCIAQNLWYKNDIKESIDKLRLHHQLLPMEVIAEPEFPENITKHLQSIGHNVTTYIGIGSAVTGISNINGNITANSDRRRQGRSAGF